MSTYLINTIINLIKQCLLKDGYVIIPNVGTFFVETQPARFNEKNNTFLPPQNVILFNHSIKQSDGVLAILLAKTCKVSVYESVKYLNDFGEFWHSQLKYNKEFELEGIGKFRVHEKNIIFRSSENALEQIRFYGLKPIVFSNREVDSTIIFSYPESQQIIRKWIKAAMVIPIFVAFSLLPTKTNINTNKKTDASIFNRKKLIEKIVLTNDNIEKTIDTLTNLKVALAPELKIVSKHVQDSSKQINQFSEYDAEPIQEIKKEQTKRYYIIIASFTSQKQVENYKSSLKEMGEELITLNCNGKLRVAYKSFDSREEANIGLMELKKKRSEMDGWILYW